MKKETLEVLKESEKTILEQYSESVKNNDSKKSIEVTRSLKENLAMQRLLSEEEMKPKRFDLRKIWTYIMLTWCLSSMLLVLYASPYANTNMILFTISSALYWISKND